MKKRYVRDPEKEKEHNERWVQIVNEMEYEPDEDFEEIYGLILSEGEFGHRGYWYGFQHISPKWWDIIIQDMNNPEQAGDEQWYNHCPRVKFESMRDIVSQFKLLNDNRTLLEIYCEYYGKQCPLILPPPKRYPDV